MKNFLIKLTLVSLIIPFGYTSSVSQVVNHNNYLESITFFTDRTLYTAGENIQFAAYINFEINQLSSDTTNEGEVVQVNHSRKLNSNFSDIVYIELITPNGEKILGGKFLISDSYCASCFTLPNDISTGIYYLRAYTKFMRNKSNNSYNYIALKIINPSKPVITSYNQSNQSSIDTNRTKTSSINDNEIEISIDKSEYSTREPVVIHIAENTSKGNSLKKVNISVIPDYSIYENQHINFTSGKSSNQFFYPETNGVSLTGRLKDGKSDSSLALTKINLSLLSDEREVYTNRTDSTGHFYFQLPNLYGVRNVFLSTDNLVDSKSIIQVDNDFCQIPVSIPTPMFKLSDEEKKIALSLAQNTQIASNYNKTISKDSVRKYYNSPFYGEPNSRLILDNYIQLPTVEDYINELIPILKIQSKKGKKSFKIFSYKNDVDLYEPLVLLDMIAIDDVNKILSIPPQKISCIEIVNEAYVKGDFTYGGIISVITKNNDFGGIDLPSSGVFLDYYFLTDCKNSNLAGSLSSKIPDARNTLYWNPNFSLIAPKGATTKTGEIAFNTSDNPGRYTILLRGITSKGEIVTCKKTFTVK